MAKQFKKVEQFTCLLWRFTKGRLRSLLPHLSELLMLALAASIVLTTVVLLFPPAKPRIIQDFFTLDSSVDRISSWDIEIDGRGRAIGIEIVPVEVDPIEVPYGVVEIFWPDTDIDYTKKPHGLEAVEVTKNPFQIRVKYSRNKLTNKNRIFVHLLAKDALRTMGIYLLQPYYRQVYEVRMGNWEPWGPEPSRAHYIRGLPNKINVVVPEHFDIVYVAPTPHMVCSSPATYTR